MTERELDVLMKRVLLDAVKEEYSGQSEADQTFHASRRYQRQNKAMLADPLSWERRQRRPAWKLMLQRVAMILVVIVVGFGAVIAAVPSARAAVIRWAVDWYESHVVYTFAGEDISGEMPKYRIASLPEGYREVEGERIEESNYVSLTYRNEDGDVIYFDYLYMQDGILVDFNAENSTVFEVTVNGRAGQLFLANDQENNDNTIAWMDTSRNLYFTIDAKCSETDILHMAESVILDKTTKNEID